MRSLAVGITFRLAAGAAIVAAAAFLGDLPGAASSHEPSPGTVTVIASWTGTEGSDFHKVLTAFQNATGIQVTYTGTRGLDQLLQSDIQQGDPPDLAILPSPGELLQYQREGYLVSLDSAGLSAGQVAKDYGPQWLSIMKLGTSHLYTLAVKADLQNLVWYAPQDWPAGTMPGRSQPPSWSQLVALENRAKARGGAAWCLGLDSPPISGWPGTGWIDDILLAQSGTSVYQQWADGDLAWTSPPVQEAWQTWGQLVTGQGQVYGGSMAALVSPWTGPGASVSTEPLFTKPPGCYLQDAPSFITLEYQQFPNDQRPGTGYDFFPFPATGLPDQSTRATTGTWEVSADLLAMFHDTPDASRLVRFLASTKAQGIWPAIPDGGASSADRKVPLSTYPDPVGRAVAGTLTSNDATLCFDASDLMPATLQNAFYEAVMEFLQTPGQLKNILESLDQIRKAAYAGFPGRYPDYGCGP